MTSGRANSPTRNTVTGPMDKKLIFLRFGVLVNNCLFKKSVTAKNRKNDKFE